jgi:HAE1 family hydrophobic/amphiphilic exporter-1
MKKISACLLLSGLVSAALAQTNAPTRALSLQDCIAAAIQDNFDVRIERYEPEKAQLTLTEAYAGYEPTLSMSGTHSHNNASGLITTNNYGLGITEENSFSTSLGGSLPSGTTYSLFGNVADTYEPSPESAGGQVGVQVTQPLLKNLWIDSTRLGITAAKSQVKLSEQALRQQLITTVTAVETAYYELIYAIDNVEVERQALALAQTQLDQDRQRVQFGSLAPLDVQQDESQVAQSRADLIAAISTRDTDQRVLKNLITDEYSKWHATDIQPTMTLNAVLEPFDLQDSWGKGLTQRPDLLEARLNLTLQGIQLKYDRNQVYPELDLVGSFGYNGAGYGYRDTFDDYGAGNRPFYTYGAQISMPLSNLKARSAYQADKATEKQLLLKLKQLEQMIMVEIDNAIGVARSDYESVEATKQARVYAEAALDAEQKKYAVGKSTTFTVLQLQNKLTAARSAELRALANYHQAVASLAQQEGSTLQRRNVDLTVK